MIQTRNNVLALIFCFFAFDAIAATKCRPHRPSTSLNYKVEPTEYLRNLSAHELTAFHSASGPHTVLGLAGGKVGTSFEASFEVKPVTGNLYCLNLKKIDAMLFAKPQVHIAKNFKRGTCEYNAVLKHEEKHVTTLIRAHKEYIPHYRKHLRVTSKKVPVLQPMTLHEANQKKYVLIEQIKKDLQSYLDKITEDVAQRQRKVDSEKEYRRVWDRCKKWEKRLNE